MSARRPKTFAKQVSRWFPWWTAAGVVALFGALTAAIADDHEESSELDGVGGETFQARAEQATGAACASACHGWEVIFDGPRQVPAQWDFIVSDMIARGAAVADDQRELIKRYLKWSWGAVWINSASAEDLVAVLALPEEQARAVVEYREQHGPFADLESLAAVPGVDAAIIEAGADAIIFN